MDRLGTTQTKHTPGPWTFDDEQPYPLQVFNSDAPPGRLELCNLGGNGFCPESDEENRANARLMAAAPDLLTMLERFYACTYGHDIPTLCQLDYQQARQAIAKAKGGA